jgi:hypothetical protein
MTDNSSDNISDTKKVLISSIPLILVFLLGAIFQNWIIPEPNFEIRLDPPWTDLSIDSQTSINLSITDASPLLRHYKYDIALAADRLNGDDLPPGIKVTLDPAVCNGNDLFKEDFKSIMNIATEKSVSPGSYTLRITGYGADGKLRSAFLVLDVHE